MLFRSNTVHGFVDATGALVARYVYDAWGNLLEFSVSVPALADNRYLFQGREYSWATGLYNFRARWYDSVTGCWISRDPIGVSGGMNLYSFCWNCPVLIRDALGLCGGLPWYDRVGAWTKNVAETAKDFYAEHLPWQISGAINTGIDLATGPLMMPSAIGHLGEGTGTFVGDPSWENAKGVLNDGLVVVGIASLTTTALPSLTGSAVKAGTPVYRVYGDGSGPLGKSWTPVDPRTVNNYRNAAGLPNENTGRFVVEGVLKSSRGVVNRFAKPLDGNTGGLVEWVVPNPKTQIRIRSVQGLNPEF